MRETAWKQLQNLIRLCFALNCECSNTCLHFSSQEIIFITTILSVKKKKKRLLSRAPQHFQGVIMFICEDLGGEGLLYDFKSLCWPLLIALWTESPPSSWPEVLCGPHIYKSRYGVMKKQWLPNWYIFIINNSNIWLSDMPNEGSSIYRFLVWRENY